MPISSQLSALSAAAPVLNERARKAATAAAMTTAAPMPVSTMSATLTAGAEDAKRAGDIGLASQKDSQAQAAELAKTELANYQASKQNNVAALQLVQGKSLAEEQRQQQVRKVKAELIARKQITNDEIESSSRMQRYGIEQDNRLISMTVKQRQDLAKLGGDVKGKLFDARLKFERDEAGRKFSNDRQLADWKISQSKSAVDMQDFINEYKFKSEMKVALLKASAARLQQDLDNGYLMEKLTLDHENDTKIQNEITAMNQKAAREAAGHQERIRAWQAGGTIVGGVIGGVFGVGVGAVGGAAIGGALGTAIGAAVEGG